MNRDFSLKPRQTGDLPPEKLEQILGRIYTEETVEELMKKLCTKEVKEDGSAKD